MQDWLASRVISSPDTLAVIFKDTKLSYKDLNNLVIDLTSKLQAWGITHGNKVAILMENRIDYIVLIHAIIRLKAITIPINSRLTSTEMKWQLDHTNTKFIICSKKTENLVISLINEDYHVITVDEVSKKKIPSVKDIKISHQKKLVSIEIKLPEINCIIFTSGTTGNPKGVMLSFKNHFYSALASAFQLGTLPNDRWILCMPLYHVGGLSILFRSCIYGTTIILHRNFKEKQILNSIENNSATLISLVPVMLQRLLDFDGLKLAKLNLRLILVGGDALLTPLIDRCKNLNLPIATTYGLTEAASQVATALPEFVYENPSSVGKPLLFTKIQIVGPNGLVLERGEIGEIIIRGPTIMSGYYNINYLTADKSVYEIHSGDLGYIDSNGNLHVMQRRIDLIISGGENVYPREVEDVLNNHPEIIEACVVGLEDLKWGQSVSALVVKTKSSSINHNDIIKYCQRYLAGYKIPRKIKFVESLPKTVSGKIKRKVVKGILKKA